MSDEDKTAEAEKLLRNPPKGAWVKKDNDKELIGVSTLARGGFILLPFSLLFCGFSYLGFSQILKNESTSLVPLLVMLPFAAASIFLVITALYSLFGKVELVINKKEPDYIFTGIGSIGKTRNIKWKSIKEIHEKTTYHKTRNTHSSRGAGRHQYTTYAVKNIYIEGEETIKISAKFLNAEKLKFLLCALLYYKDIKTRYGNFF